MPKIVDHDAYRLEITTKAVEVFIEHGYHGLGMRGIAAALGLSKSALYHYFPSKEHLFAACTKLVTQPENIYGVANDEEIPLGKHEAITAMLEVLDGRFQGEITLLFDYVRGKSAADIAADSLMKSANAVYQNELAKFVGDKNSDQAFALLYGGLLMRSLTGGQIEIDAIASWIMALETQE